MSVTVDTLDVKIQASARGANKSVNSLIATLDRLKGVLSGGIGADKTTSQLQSIANYAGSSASSVSSLVTMLKNLSGIKVSQDIGKQLRGISSAITALDASDADVVDRFTTSLAGLGSLPKLDMKESIKQIKDLPKALKGIADVDFTAFRKKIEELNDVLTPLSNTMRNISGQANAVKSGLTEIAAGAKGLGSSGSKVSNFTKSLLSIAAVRQAAKIVADLTNKSLQYVENLNLFSASLGKYADEAQRYAETVSDVMGIDPSSFMRNQGVFYTLADGFGVASERALVMSRNLTQLGYDLASFFNISSDDAMQKLQSGISGELEPLRRLGYDLSQAKLQAIAFGLGIDKAYASMTQAEKAQLRYYAIMTQVTTAQGDMARTLNAPANQLRIFKEQASQAGRALGNIFIPMLNAILPVAIAAAKAIRVIASAIASLFGYSLPEISYDISSGIGGIGSSAEDAAGGMDKASGSAKKLKSILMGFDEINQIPDMSGGGGGGGGGAGGGGVLDGFNFELPEYNFLADMVSSNVDRIYAKVEPFVNWFTQNLDTIGAYVLAIGAQFLNWQLAKKFISDLTIGEKLIAGLKAGAAAITSLVITAAVSYKLSNDFTESGNYGTLVAEGLSSILGSVLVGASVAKASGNTAAGIFTASTTLAITGIINISAAAGAIEANGLNGNSILQQTIAVAKLALAGAGIAKAVGFSMLAGGAVGLTIGAVIAVAATFDAVNQHKLKQNVNWGDVNLAREEVVKFAQNMLTVDVAATVNVVNANINNRAEAASKVNTSVMSLRSAIFPLRLGVALDENGLTAIQTAANQLVTDFNALESATKASIQMGVSLVPPQDGGGNDLSAAVISMSNNASGILQAEMTRLGNDLAYWINEGMTDGLSETEGKMIEEISTSMMRISNALAQGKAAGEFQAGVGVLLSELTPESFDAVLAEYKTLYKEYENALERAAIEGVGGIKSQAAGMFETGYTEAAERMEALAAETIAGIPQSVAKQLETQTEPVRQMVVTEMQKIFGGVNLDIPFLKDAVAYYVSTGMSSDAIASEIENIIYDAFDRKDYARILKAGEVFGFTEWDVFTSDTQMQLYNALAGVIGDEQTLALLRDFGYDLSAITKELGIVSEVTSETGTEIEQLVSETEAFSAEVDTATSEIKDLTKKTDSFESSASDLVNTVSDAQANVNALGDSATNTTGYLATASSGAEALADKIVEIPSSKTIAISISNFSAINANIVYLANKLKDISDKTVTITIKTGLASAAKSFFKVLGALAGGSFQTSLNSLINLSAFARGGFPTKGQLFIANESGPELVGRIGNKTAVANEGQIGETIFRYMEAHDRESGGSGIDNDALAAAIAAALKRAGIGTVYLDGRKLADSINRETQRSGKPAITF